MSTLELGGLAGASRGHEETVTPDEIVALYLPRVHRFAAMVCPAGADPEDLAQHAMLRAVEQVARQRLHPQTAEAWLWRVVVNAARDHGRVLRRSRLIFQRLVDRGSDLPEGASAEGLVLDRLRDEDLIAAVRRLPFRYRRLIALRYGADLSTIEISRCLGSSRMSVAKALRRALDRLRADLTRLEEA